MKLKTVKICTLLLLPLVIQLASCTIGKTRLNSNTETTSFFGLSEIIARELISSGDIKLNKNERIILTSFVNLDNLYQTSGFGRSMTEALSTELFQLGFKIIELRKLPKIYISQGEGELTLSRDASLLARQHNAQAILTGTYSLTPSTVILNAKILSAFSRDVIAAGSLEIRRTANINYLLTENKETVIGPISAYER